MMAAHPPIRILTAVPICDGHDSAINTVNMELIRHGVEVIYLGYHRSVKAMVRAAIQEDVRTLGISSYNGGHVEFFSEVVKLLRKHGAGDIHVFGGGGGTITRADEVVMTRRGVDRIFFAGTSLSEIVAYVKKQYGGQRKVALPSLSKATHLTNRQLAKLLTAAETNIPIPSLKLQPPTGGCRTIGIAGPGGAGKTTLIDELVLRHLTLKPHARVAILSHDPSGSVSGGGALLGDRAPMIYSQDDRVFMRSLASRGHDGGLAACTRRCVQVLQRCGFELILIETVGIGQEAVPFRGGLTDRTVLVMSPDYGSRLQLQKIAMLDVADLVVVNKSDLGGAKTALSEIAQRLESNQRGQQLLTTVAKQHRNAGVDELFNKLVNP